MLLLEAIQTTIAHVSFGDTKVLAKADLATVVEQNSTATLATSFARIDITAYAPIKLGVAASKIANRSGRRTNRAGGAVHGSKGRSRISVTGSGGR